MLTSGDLFHLKIGQQLGIATNNNFDNINLWVEVVDIQCFKTDKIIIGNVINGQWEFSFSIKNPHIAYMLKAKRAIIKNMDFITILEPQFVNLSDDKLPGGKEDDIFPFSILFYNPDKITLNFSENNCEEAIKYMNNNKTFNS